MCRRGETFFIRVFLVGVVRRYAAYAGDVAEVLRLLATGPEFSASMSFGSLAVLVVGVFVGAVSERHQPERDVLGFLAVGVVRKDVADEAQLVSSYFLKECWCDVAVERGGWEAPGQRGTADASLRSEPRSSQSHSPPKPHNNPGKHPNPDKIIWGVGPIATLDLSDGPCVTHH